MSDPRRVLFIHHGSGGGGAANSLLSLINGLDRDLFEPLVACNYEFPKSREFFAGSGLDPIHLPVAPFVHTSRSWRLTTPRGLARFVRWLVSQQPRFVRALRQYLDQHSPDLVHLNGVSLLPAAAVAHQAGIPVVQHIRESVNDGALGIRKHWLASNARRFVDTLVYICKDGQDRFSVPGTRARLVHNPINLDVFQPRDSMKAKDDLNIPMRSTVLFFPGGSLFDIKGIFPFLQALARLRMSNPTVVAIIPGIDQLAHARDEVRHKIERSIRDKALETCILRLPFTTSVERYYAAADVVVAPFVLPHFSRAVIESGAMGKPIVGSRIGGITEVLEDGVTGLLATPDDADDLADKIHYILERPAEAAQMGHQGRIVAQERFSMAKHALAMQNVFRETLQSHTERQTCNKP